MNLFEKIICATFLTVLLLLVLSPSRSDAAADPLASEALELLLQCSRQGELSEWNAWVASGTTADELGRTVGAVDLSGINLAGANLRGANLSGIILDGANLYSADLRGADLTHARLRQANLCHANLRGAALPQAQMQGAHLYQADLSDADLQGADLRDTNLRKTRQEGTNLDSVDLRGAVRYQSYFSSDRSLLRFSKPNIYLYPETTIDVDVQLDFDGTLEVAWPPYRDGWKVTARPDGTLTDRADGQEYSYLFWEGRSDATFDFSEGFVVRGSETAAFLRKALSRLGLTPREYNEFIVFWLPLMQDNPWNLIAFQGANYTDRARLTIEPKPGSVLRVYMAFQPLAEPVELPPQDLKPFDRKGFTVVEWGGSAAVR